MDCADFNGILSNEKKVLKWTKNVIMSEFDSFDAFRGEKWRLLFGRKWN